MTDNSRFAVALLTGCLALAAPPPAAAADSGSLHLVRRIHIGKLAGDYPERTALVQAALEKELRKAGFEVVDDRTMADASLSATADSFVVLDRDETDPAYPRNSYSLRLNQTATGEQVWYTKVYINEGQRLEGEAREVARVAVWRLAAARKRSARRAAHGR